MKKSLFFIFSLIVFPFFVDCNRAPSETKSRHPHTRHSKFHRDHSKIDRMAGDLGLSGEQLEQLKKLEKEIDEKRTEMRRDEKGRDSVKAKIVEMIRADSLSKEEIFQFMEELHSLGEQQRAEIDSFTAERLAKMHSILTEEQREKLARKIEEFEPRRDFEPEKDKR
ncbi:MAG: Spy/CpxP family protein refolding chaperone [candidate division WOR-3 bacterium]|jgi:Spy/CpxP family protein refolding chaperone